MFLSDFHIHSNFSDGKHTIPELVDFYGSLGFGAIAFTDHLCETQSIIGKAAVFLKRSLTPSTFQQYMEILRSEGERAMKQYNMLVIPGYECSVNTLFEDTSFHIIGLGIQNYNEVTFSVEQTANNIHADGGITVAAHPVDTGLVDKQTLHLWRRKEHYASYIDAWEVASGKHLFQEVLQSGLRMVASSDLHVKKHIDSWKTVLNCEKKVEAVLEAIMKQEVDFQYFHFNEQGQVP